VGSIPTASTIMTARPEPRQAIPSKHCPAGRVVDRDTRQERLHQSLPILWVTSRKEFREPRQSSQHGFHRGFDDRYVV
jgi:hypothetical protein